MSHTIYVTRIILRPLSALFGLQFMMPMKKSEWITRSFINKAKEGGHVRIIYNFSNFLPNILYIHLYKKKSISYVHSKLIGRLSNDMTRRENKTAIIFTHFIWLYTFVF